MKSIYLGLLVMTGVVTAANAQDYRTDINPALRYWEAFMLGQQVSQSNRDQLMNNDWRGQILPAKFGEWLAPYNQELRLIKVAAQAKVPCDWGVDLSEGPELLLPHLARAKEAAQVTRLRVMWDLQNSQPAEATEDLLATLALARNVSRDGTLISVLVQIAMENILLSTVAENFYQFSPDALKRLEDGLEAAPPRGTMAQAVGTGERCFYNWFERKAEEARDQHPGDEAAAMASIHATLLRVMSPQENGDEKDSVDKMLKAAGTSEGMLKLLAELPPMYDRAEAIMALPKAEFEAQIGPFKTEIQDSPNPFISELFPALARARAKEFAVLGKLGMLKAAVEYKLNGAAGLNSVKDPTGERSFVLRKFAFAGKDRGFELSWGYDGVGYPDVLIFTESGGAPFNVLGQHAGEAPAN